MFVDFRFVSFKKNVFAIKDYYNVSQDKQEDFQLLDPKYFKPATLYNATNDFDGSIFNTSALPTFYPISLTLFNQFVLNAYMNESIDPRMVETLVHYNIFVDYMHITNQYNNHLLWWYTFYEAFSLNHVRNWKNNAHIIYRVGGCPTTFTYRVTNHEHRFILPFIPITNDDIVGLYMSALMNYKQSNNPSEYSKIYKKLITSAPLIYTTDIIGIDDKLVKHDKLTNTHIIDYIKETGLTVYYNVNERADGICKENPPDLVRLLFLLHFLYLSPLILPYLEEHSIQIYLYDDNKDIINVNHLMTDCDIFKEHPLTFLARRWRTDYIVQSCAKHKRVRPILQGIHKFPWMYDMPSLVLVVNV